MGKARLASWEVSTEFWSRVEPLLPLTPGRDKKQQYARAEGAGRKRKDLRLILDARIRSAHRLSVECVAGGTIR